VSKDTLARGPYLTQFLADPRYAPLPQVAVAAAGRVFKAFGHIAFKEREEPWLNTLAAFSGYNGTLLWRREIAPALMVHRNTLIATATNVYFADDQSCKVFDAATGEPKGEIAPPAGLAGGTFWKWMALEGNVLYAMIGEQELRDPTLRTRSTNHGWPWAPLSPGFNSKEQPWGYGNTLLAIDVNSKNILWRYTEKQPMDARAVCMKNGRIYAFSFGNYLTCLDANTGSPVYRLLPGDSPQLFEALGEYQSPGLALELADHGFAALQRQGPVLRRAGHATTGRGRRRQRQSHVEPPLRQLPAHLAGRHPLRDQRPD
jgi:hypothetical protein